MVTQNDNSARGIQRRNQMFDEIVGETPRQRIKRLNKQIEYWKCFGDTRNCAQPICTFCQHLRIWRDYEGGSEADCLVNANQWLAGDEVHHCRRFKAARQWRYMSEQLLNDAMADIIRDLTGRLTGAKKVQLANKTLVDDLANEMAKGVIKDEQIAKLKDDIKVATDLIEFLKKQLRFADKNYLDLKNAFDNQSEGSPETPPPSEAIKP